MIFGVCISLFAITSFESLSNSSQKYESINNQECQIVNSDAQSNSQLDNNSDKREQKLKTHHNFIASYLLQESSIKRESKKMVAQGNFIRNLKHVHKTIIVHTIGLF
jgi:hypothetical protein